MSVPRLAARLLARALPADERDMVLGDLEEAFHHRVESGRGAPRAWYWTQALLFCVSFGAERARERLGGFGHGGGAQAAGPGPALTKGRGAMFEAWMRDGRLAFRALRRRPGFAAVAIGTLALGIGANTAIFSVIYGSVLRPLPYPGAGELVWIGERYKEWDHGRSSMNRANYHDLKAGATRLAGMAAYEIESSNFSGQDEPVRIRGAQVTPGFLGVLGIPPRLGRDFVEADNHRDGAPTILLTDRLWRERFASAPGVVGRTVSVNGEPHVVLGVLPPEFTFLGEPRFLKPFRWDGVDPTRSGRRINAIGRLAADVPLGTAWDELTALYARLEADHPEENGNWTVWVEPLRTRMLDANNRSLTLLGAAVLMVLLIACVNVANLLLVRAETRQRELAVRLALGSGRAGLIPTFLSESLLIGAIGGLLGLLAAQWGVDTLVALYGESLPRADDIALSGPMLAFGVALSLLTGLVVGMVPLVRMDGARLQDQLREGARGATDRGNRMKRSLVTVEVGLAVLLVTAAGLLINSFWRLNRVDLGVDDPHEVLTFRISLPGARYAERASVVEFYDGLLEEIERLPGVEAVGLDNRTPLVGGANLTNVFRKDDPELVSRFVELRYVTSGLFGATGIPILRGRLWSAAELADTSDAGMRVVISEAMAAQLFPDREAVGGRIDPRWNDDGYEVIGIAGDVREMGAERAAPPMLYLPYPGPGAPSGMLAAVRTRGDPLALAPRVRAAVKTLDPEIPVYAVRLLSDVAADRLDSRRFGVSLLAIFAVLALLLGAIGIYGVISYTVAQRTREMGVRLALGASRENVRGLVLGQALRLALPGLVVGLVAAFVAGSLMDSMLFEVPAADLPTYTAATVLLALVCAGASVVPAWRATRVDPATSLRAE